MNAIDILRSVLIGQTIWTVLWIFTILFMTLRLRLRPGIRLGIGILALGNLTAIVYTLLSVIAKFGQPSDYKTWLATIAILSESLGCVLIAAHIFFHDEQLINTAKRMFHAPKSE